MSYFKPNSQLIRKRRHTLLGSDEDSPRADNHSSGARTQTLYELLWPDSVMGEDYARYLQTTSRTQAPHPAQPPPANSRPRPLPGSLTVPQGPGQAAPRPPVPELAGSGAAHYGHHERAATSIGKQFRNVAQERSDADNIRLYLEAAQYTDAPFVRFDTRTLRALTQAELSPVLAHRASRGLRDGGFSRQDLDKLDFTSQERQALERIMGGDNPLQSSSLGWGSPFGNLILQGEGRESDKKEAQTIHIERRAAFDSHTGKPYREKVYLPYLDSRRKSTIGPGLRMYDQQDIADLKQILGEANIRPDQVENGKIVLESVVTRLRPTEKYI
jgi:hypothetical protein